MKRRVNSIGAWARKGLGNPGDVVKRLVDLNLDEASFLLNAGVEPVYISRISPAKLRHLTELAKVNDITPWWMTFPHSTDKRVALYLADITAHLKDCPPRALPEGIEIDAENRHDKIGWGPSGARLALPMLKGLKELGVTKVYVTCVIFRSGLRKQDMALIEAANELGLWVGLAPQGYSKDDPSKTWDNGRLFRPGVMQSFVMDICGPLTEDGTIDELRMGGMVAYQNHPEPWPDNREALEVAHDTAYSRGCRAWRYWVLDQVSRRDGDEDFLRRASHRTAPAGYVFDPEDAEPEPAPTPTPEAGGRRAKVKALQERLIVKGYQPGGVDGLIGPKTRAAIEAYKMALCYVPASWADAELDGLIEDMKL